MNNNLYHEKYDGSNEAEVFRHEVIRALHPDLSKIHLRISLHVGKM